MGNINDFQSIVGDQSLTTTQDHVDCIITAPSTTYISSGVSYTIDIPIPLSPEDVVLKNPDGSITIGGDVKFGDSDESLQKRLDRIERAIGVTQRRRTLEENYPELKDLGDQMDEAIDEMSASIARAISKVTKAYDEFVGECEIMEKLKSENDNT